MPVEIAHRGDEPDRGVAVGRDRAPSRSAASASTTRSSTAICDGPSSPIETPACDPHRRRFARLIAPMRTKSAARDRNAPNVAANAVLPSACMPVWAPTTHCSAMYIWKNRSGATASKSSVWVELPTSPSRTTRSGTVAGEPRQRLPERLAGGDRLGVGGRAARRGARPATSGFRASGPRRRDRERADAPELLDRGAFLVGGHRLAVPALLVGEERDAVALLGPRDDQRGLVGGAGLRVGRDRSRRRRGRRSRSSASRRPAPAGRTGRRPTRASWGRAGRAG